MRDVPADWLRFFDFTGDVARCGAAALLDEQTGTLTSGSGQRRPREDHDTQGLTYADDGYVRPVSEYTRDGDTGGASRFFYCAKSSSSERSAGLLDGERSTHPTVKPIALMRWLVRLVTPPGGTILDPFTGSGTTGCAAVLEGFRFVGIEREAEYAAIARGRIAWWTEHPDGMELIQRLEYEKEQKAKRDAGQIGLFDA